MTPKGITELARKEFATGKRDDDAYRKLWICREPVTVDGTETRLSAFPELSRGRVIKRIIRDNSYGTEPQENGVQDWLLPITVKYEYDWEKW